MIGFLKGKVKYISEEYVLIYCNGVGYKVEIGDVDSNIGEETELYIYTHVRENELRLFGFKKIEDLSIFEMLLDVSGVGPKVAASLVSQIGSENIINCILCKDAKGLKVSGVGIRTADKIILELFDKLTRKGYSLSSKDSKTLLKDKKLKTRLEEAGEALESLGYSKTDISRCISSIEYTEDVFKMKIEELVKYLLSKIK